MSSLKIKILSKNMLEKPTNTPIINSVYWLCMVASTCFGITLPSSWSVPSAFWEMLNWGTVDRILWMWRVVVSNLVCGTHHVTRNNTPIHNIPSTALQLSISQKALGMLPEDGNVMQKHTEAYLLTYSMEQSPSWEADQSSQLVKKFPAFMEPASSLPYSQMPATRPYP